MLVEFSFENFFSFAEEASVSFELGKRPAKSGYDYIYNEENRLNTAIAVVGPNGGGKTNLLRPLYFLFWFMEHSFSELKPDESLPFLPHFLNDAPSKLMLRFLLNGSEYKYEVELSESGIIHEGLYMKAQGALKYKFLFVRQKNGDSFQYKQKGFGLTLRQVGIWRSNASTISTAIHHQVPLALEINRFLEHVYTNLHLGGRDNFSGSKLIESANFFHENEKYVSKMEEALSSFDLGLSKVELKKTTAQTDFGKKEDIVIPVGIHKKGDKEFKVPFFMESTGTQSAFVLLEQVLPALSNGGVVLIDEIDNDLHPHILPYILDWFRFDNPKHAQIVFTCHTPEILNILMKHQVYLVEKIEQESEAWRLDEVEGLRSDDNLYAKYMAGALSAVPNF